MYAARYLRLSMHSSYTRGGSNTICNVAWLLQSTHEICYEHLILQVVMYAFVPCQLSGRGCESCEALCVAAWEAGRGCESRDVLCVAVCDVLACRILWIGGFPVQLLEFRRLQWLQSRTKMLMCELGIAAVNALMAACADVSAW